MFEIAQCSFPGGRPVNEDAVFAMEQNGLTVAAVADGLGGHARGEMASAAAIAALYEALPGMRPLSAEAVRAAYRAANAAVLAGQPAMGSMKTTLAAFFHGDGRTVFSHTGDTRLYHFREGRLVYQSADHSASQMAVYAGEITLREIRSHPDRNQVIHALGEPGEPWVELCAFETPLQPRDAFLLCSDGFWEYVLEDEMLFDLVKTDKAADWLALMLPRLVRRAKAGHDNFSAVALRFQGTDV